MVSAISALSSFDVAGYLSQIKGVKPVAATPPVSAAPSTPSKAPSTTTKPATTTGTTPSNLLGLSSDVLSLLQETSPSSSASSQLSNLFGSSSASSSDPLSGLYSALLAKNASTLPTQTAVQATQTQATQTSATSKDPLQALLTSYNNAANSYNRTLLQNAQSVLTANSAPITA